MTKDQELDIIREAISKLGQDSYLGPWLKYVIKSVEMDIRGDVRPAITPSDSLKMCEEKLAAAQRVADRKILDANKEAKRIKTAAISNIRGLLRGISVNLVSAKDEVEARIYRLDDEEKLLTQ